jgi:hypothetical protein
MKTPMERLFLQSAVILFALSSITLCPLARAVVPPPDGAYPNFNTAAGQSALFNLSTGQWNTALGGFTLWKNTDGSFNTAVGTAALLLNVGDQSASTGIENTAVGAASLLFNTTGSFNTATGVDALFSNTSGSNNTATGVAALFSNTGASGNTAFGSNALLSNATTDADNNTAVGSGALQGNINGASNTAIGAAALLSYIGGLENTAIGFAALSNGTLSANHNTAVGSNALLNTAADANTAFGSHALSTNVSGLGNTAVGRNALMNSTGGFNTAVGFGAGTLVTDAHDVIVIGATGGANVNNSCFIANIRDRPVGADAQTVSIDSTGKLGTMVSSRRFKTDIKPMEKVSEAVMALKPVTFHYKNDTKGIPQFGLIAEEVAEVNPDLVVRDANGEIYSVRYEAVNAMLLNEFQKEHRKNDQQEATIAELRQEIEALTTGLQKVSAQLELKKPAPRIVLNNR